MNTKPSDKRPVNTPVFDVPRLNAWGSKLLSRNRQHFVALARLENNFLAEKIAATDISRPIFVCGLARSGTTILLELLSRHGETASQRYLDYPFVFTPYMWNRYLGFAKRDAATLAERSHKDGLLVSAESPEAMEEPLWMHFFPDGPSSGDTDIRDEKTKNDAFESFYKAHMAKLLLVRKRSRYLAKGNYHIARIGYLSRLFPQARFIVPIRDPLNHIASSMKQHALFARGQAESADARLYLSQIGHFEFGLDRRPINVDSSRTRDVLDLWSRGDEVGGWATYWSAIHDHIADVLDRSDAMRQRIRLVSYEALCRKPATMAHQLLDHCGLADDGHCTEWARDNIEFKPYYKPGFSPAEASRIEALTRPAFSRLQPYMNGANIGEPV